MSVDEQAKGHERYSDMETRIDRTKAARWLRQARAGDEESIDWVFSVLPESVAARRLMISRALEQDHHEAADVLLAQGLLQRPEHGGLVLLRALSLFQQARHDEAARELAVVLRNRPSHRGGLLLSGRIELARGNHEQAAARFEHLHELAPSDDVRTWSIRAALAADRPHDARKMLGSMLAPSPALNAAVLRAERRFLEAIEQIETALVDANKDEALLCDLIELLEQTADARRLRDVLAPITAAQPRALLQAAKAWLALGAFETAARRVLPLLRRCRSGESCHRGPALAVLLVAATMIGRRRLAQLSLRRLQRETRINHPGLTAELWGRGLLGQVLFDQRSSRRAGSDPRSERLGQLLGAAEPVLRTAIRAGTGSEPWLEPHDLLERANRCQSLLKAIRRPAGDPARAA